MESVYSDITEYEKEVAAYLKELGLYWMFESPIFVYDEKARPRVRTPDFYIPKLGMHIEVWGSAERDHTYREEIYKKNDYNVIFRPRLQTPQRLEKIPDKKNHGNRRTKTRPSHQNATSTTILGGQPTRVSSVYQVFFTRQSR